MSLSKNKQFYAMQHKPNTIEKANQNQEIKVIDASPAKSEIEELNEVV